MGRRNAIGPSPDVTQARGSRPAFGCRRRKKIALLLKGYGLTGAGRVTHCTAEGGQRVAAVEVLWLLT